MSHSKVLLGERQQNILKILEKDGSVSVEELAKMFSVSGMTIRRDLHILEAKNRIERFHGGAVLRDEVQYREKEVQNIFGKKRIAEKALALLLKEREELYIVTTDLMIAGILQNGKVGLFFCGGEIQKSTGSSLGSLTVEQLRDFSFDIAFLGTSAINSHLELSTPTVEKVSLKRTVLQKAKKAVLLADESKFDKQAMMRICNVEEFDVLVTDKALSDKEEKELKKKGVEFYSLIE